MTYSMLPTYDLFLQSLQNSGTSYIRCDELFKQYKSLFFNNYNIFTACLDYLKQNGKIETETIDVEGENFYIAIKVL